MKPVLLVGAFDTKGDEYLFVKAAIECCGLPVCTLNVGCAAEPTFVPDIDAKSVAEAAGKSLEALQQAGDRGQAVQTMECGVVALAPRLAPTISGVLALGGSAGTTICTALMRALPFGLPKLMVSSVVARDVKPYVGNKDICLMHSVIDVAGLNKFSRRLLHNAAMAMVGMVQYAAAEPVVRAIQVAATMLGVTTPCVTEARKILEEAGCEVIVFHANGGGASMEALIRAGEFDAVLDATTTEWADQCIGGIRGAGSDRLLAAGQCGLPHVVSLGALDMVNFGPPETLPEAFAQRLLYPHNSTVTLMRTTAEECVQIGQVIAHNLNQSTVRATLFIPHGGLSSLDAPGQPFWNPDALAALSQTLHAHCLPERVEIIDSPLHMNDPAFARELAKRLLRDLHAARTLPQTER